MRFRSRWRMSAVAIALLVSIATLGVPHDAEPGHDSDFAVVVVGHDASAHRITADSSQEPGHAVHCVACHWARSFRPTTEATYAGAPANASLARLLTDDAPLLRRANVSQPPLRSPPLI